MGGAITLRIEPRTRIRLVRSPLTVIQLAIAVLTRIRIMADLDIYNVDDTAVITATFKDPTTGALVDPPTITLEVKRVAPSPPDDTLVHEYSGVDTAVIKRISLGTFRFFVACTAAGDWAGHVKSTGAAAGGEDFSFRVRPKPT